MKTINIATLLFLLWTAMVLLTSCEQEKVEPILNVAPGGGTISTYKAYTLEAADAQDIHGRVVFWKDNASNTLVQVSLYNTDAAATYPTAIFDGTAAEELDTELQDLYSINGATGEFSTSKFYVISDKDYFDALTTLDAHVQVTLAGVAVAKGDVGANATPVAEAE